MGSVNTSLPYWQVNVPEGERTDECPEALRGLSAKDQGILSTPDDQYHVLSWDEVRRIIADNALDRFQRVPSALRRYLEYNWALRRDHGSVMNFVLAQRLQWKAPTRPRGMMPFECADDVKILWNDWPYGIDPRIVHLVVWTKFDLAEDPVTTDLTDAARKEIEDYVNATFGSRLPRDRVSSKAQRFSAGQRVVMCACVHPRADMSAAVHMVQELAVAEVRTRRGTLPRHALRPGPIVHRRDHEWRYPSLPQGLKAIAGYASRFSPHR